MIFWKDFVLDDVIGPHLVCSDEGMGAQVRQDDEREQYPIQETRQELRPARMVGFASLESTLSVGTEADLTSSSRVLQGGGG